MDEGEQTEAMAKQERRVRNRSESGVAPTALSADRDTRRWAGIPLLALAAVAFSFHNNLARVSYEMGTDPLTVLSTRSVISLTALVVYCIIRGQSPILPFGKSGAVILIGFTFAAQSFSLLQSFAFVPVSLAILILYTFPILVILLARLVDREPLTRVKTIGAVIAFGGLALALNVFGDPFDWRGVGLAFTAAIVISINIVGTARLMRGISTMAVIVNMFTVATVIFVVALIASGGPALPGDDAEAWWIFVATVLSSPVALLAFYSALALLGSTRTSMIMNSEPILTIGLAVALFGEVLVPIQFAGAALVIGAIFLVSVYDKR